MKKGPNWIWEIKTLSLSLVEGLNSKLETVTAKIMEWKIDLKKLTGIENTEHRYRDMENVMIKGFEE